MEFNLGHVLWIVCVLLNAKGTVSQLDVCGQAPLNTKIIGGEDASLGSWPWQVSIRFKGSHFCGGSLINQNWVLSAAHCFQSYTAPDITINLGTINRITPNVIKNVSGIIVHAGYNSTTFDNDIALVQLSSSVNFSSYINPVCLAASNSSFPDGYKLWVTGWGKTSSSSTVLPEILQELPVTVVNNKACSKAYGIISFSNNLICAGSGQEVKGSCQGDSGGPLVVNVNRTWIQAGIVSFGPEQCAISGIPGAYTRVSMYENWINSKISNNQPGFVIFTASNHGSTNLFCLFPSFSIILFLCSLYIF